MAVRTRAELKADAATSIPDNVVEAIDPADVRERIVDMADSAALPGEAQTWTAPQQFARVTATAVAVAALDLDCSAGNEFTKTVAAATAFTVSSVPSGQVFHLRLLLTYTSGTITWFSGVQWPKNVAPAFTGGKVYDIVLTTQNGGTTWRGVAAEYDA